MGLSIERIELVNHDFNWLDCVVCFSCGLCSWRLSLPPMVSTVCLFVSWCWLLGALCLLVQFARFSAHSILSMKHELRNVRNHMT